MIRALRVAWAARPGLLAGGVLLAVAGSVSPALAAWLFAGLVDALVRREDGAAVVVPMIGVAVSGALAVLLPAASDLLVRRLVGHMRVGEHDDLFRAVNRQEDIRAFDEPDFHARLALARERGVDASGEVVAGGLLLLQSALLTVSFLAVLLAVHPLLVVGAAVAAVPMVLIELSLGEVRLASARELNGFSRERFLYAQAMSGHREAKEVRLLGIGDLLRRRAREQFLGAVEAEHRLARREFSMHVAATVLGLAFSLGILVWAVGRHRAGDLSLGDLTAVATSGAGVIQGLSGAVAHMGRLRHAVDVQGVLGELVEGAGPAPDGRADALPPLATAVELHGVALRYSGRAGPSVAAVDLRIGATEMVAMVGANGAGKSTLAKLLCRLYDPDQGTVTWDGLDLRAVTHASLRRRIGVLFQDPVIYELSVAENVGVGDVTRLDRRDAIEAAAALGGVDGMVRDLPRGYATRLTRMYPDPEDAATTSGVVLSGGQAQRLAIARLLMRSEVDLLVLDEPTAGLDPAGEVELLDTLRRCRSGRATLFVTHRLGAARGADRIVVVAGGTVVEDGTHDELMALDGEYARLYRLQASGYDDAPASLPQK